VQRFTVQERNMQQGAQAHCEFAECFERRDDVAIAACTRAINLGAFNDILLSELYYYRGVAYTTTGHHDHAIDDFSQAISIYPKGSEYFTGRCLARVGAGIDLDRALADCIKSLRLEPDRVNAITNEGIVHLRLNHVDNAIADFNAALKIDPKNAYPLYGRGAAKLRQGDSAAGNADVAAAERADPNVAAFFARYGISSEATVKPPPPLPPAADCARAETHWKSAESIGTLAAFEDHLARFPNCDFATLAKARIEALKK
jgi:tetratricopeptide (TPR) repeat protein